MAPPPQTTAVAVADQFGRTAKQLGRALDEAMAEHGVTTPRARVLGEVVASGPLRLSAVGAAIGISQGTASELADALVREGLMDRRADPSDRRAVLLEATAAGRERAGRWRATYEAAAIELFAPLDEAQRQQLVGLLRALER